MELTKEVCDFLSKHGLEEEQFDEIYENVIYVDKKIKLIFLQISGGWRMSSVHFLERILEIYENSTIDMKTKKIKTPDYN